MRQRVWNLPVKVRPIYQHTLGVWQVSEHFSSVYFPPFITFFLAPQLANVWPGLQEFGIDRLQACLVSEFSVIRENYCNIEKTTHPHILNRWLLVFYFSLKLNSLISLAILNVQESGRKSKLTGLIYEDQKNFIGHSGCIWELISVSEKLNRCYWVFLFFLCPYLLIYVYYSGL